MSFQVGIGSLGGTVFFQVGLCTPLRIMGLTANKNNSKYQYTHFGLTKMQFLYFLWNIYTLKQKEKDPLIDPFVFEIKLF